MQLIQKITLSPVLSSRKVITLILLAVVLATSEQTLSLKPYLVCPQEATPTLFWSTYYGGAGNEAILSACCDPEGHVIICGQTDSPDRIASSGAYQPNPGGEGDVFLAKFDSDGNRLWGTYFGGPAPDVGWCCRCDSTGTIYLSGHTLSASGIATPGAHQTSLRGERDAFLSCFSPDGLLLWSTYFGGNQQEAGYSCCTGPEGTVYLLGYTDSPDFIATPGAHQFLPGGSYDGFLAQFSSSGVLLRGSYYGGTLNDAITGSGCDANGSLFFCGGSNSPSGISTAGAHQPFNQGDFDAFMVCFDLSGNRTWGTYYGGSLADQGASLCVGRSGELFLTGYSQSPDGIATSGSHQTVLAGLTDGFICRFTTSGTRIWGSYYGGEEMDEVRSCSYTHDSILIIAGYSESQQGIATPEAWQPWLSGFRDAFVSKFSETGTRLWGTYFGGPGEDQGYACSEASGGYHLAGHTSSTDSVSTPGSHQPEFGGGDRDGFLAFFSDHPVGLPAETNPVFRLYPNPCADFLQVDAGSRQVEPVTILIFNALGQELYSSGKPVTLPARIDEGLPGPGIYFLEIREPGRIPILRTFAITENGK